MNLTAIKHFTRRHRLVIFELAVLVIVAVAGPIAAFEFDFFDSGTGPSAATIELDEALLLGGVLLAVSLALFVARRYFEQSARCAAASPPSGRSAGSCFRTP